MKKSIVTALVVVFVFSAFGAFAATTPAAKPAAAPAAAASSKLMGSVSSVDDKAMSFVVKSADGKDTTVFWNKDTKVTGAKALAAGQNVTVTWMEKDGKNWASAVKVEAPKATTKK